ncbi:hypothetical protein ACPOL_3066 [Acidisarcina polymorpha]|uniref:DUF885 domain-containing protein n=1 Tax=Acidisarcina polymorpha TaxID=2211140 RepID=A0A2Z5FZL4_9BACT|nr:DUF885 domain-containing protein [Acidisarcina polymorpha]AXC12363.1 hypothetical protein ACPOL_3066 [Acidisarcina polymorpha]
MDFSLNATAALLAMMIASANGHCQTTVVKLNKLADRFVDQQLQYDPTLSYSTGLPTRDHSRFRDRSPKALSMHDQEEREDLKALLALPIARLTQPDRVTYANLRERLESDLQLRVCRTELWNVNHFDGWQSELAEVAERQPVGSAEERKQALQRWGSMPEYLNVEIANLRLGLARGYSAPQSIVRRVIRQMDDLATMNPEQSVFYSPAKRSADATFQNAFRQLILNNINPALKSYRDFLQADYLPKAREGIAISDLPNGAVCYQAFLRSSTTLERTPQQIFDLGRKTVRENVAEIAKIGEAKYQSADLPTIVARIKSSPAEHFRSKEDLLGFSQQFLQRAKDMTAGKLITRMLQQDVVIRPLSAFEENAGVGSRFQGQPDPSKPAIFLIKLGDWQTETRSDAEIITVHEAVPGHYLQKTLARELQASTRLSKLIDNDAYAEGWARYAEAMGDEAKIYDTEDASVMRRLWPARGMVVDPGLHAFHWTRQEAVDYMVSSGHFSADAANDYVDRIAVMPGQLSSYDSGGLEIKALRTEAQLKLGARFDLRRFNRAVLDEGVVPLGELRAHLEAWIAEELSHE